MDKVQFPLFGKVDVQDAYCSMLCDKNHHKGSIFVVGFAANESLNP